MLSNLLLSGVAVPVLTGIVAGGVVVRYRLAPLAALLAGAGALFIYWLLEGFPAMPPTAVKQKLAFVFAAAGALGLVVSIFRGADARVVLGLTLIIAGACAWWFGASVFARVETWSEWLPPAGYCVLLALSSGWFLKRQASTGDGARDGGVMALATVLAFAIGSAVVALAGGFIGMGQVFGALAAFAGGLLLVAYVVSIRPNNTDPISVFDAAVPALAWSMAATGIVVTLFATSLNLFAQSLLPLIFLAGAALGDREGRFASMPAPLRPVAGAALASLPGVAAIVLVLTTPA